MLQVIAGIKAAIICMGGHTDLSQNGETWDRRYAADEPQATGWDRLVEVMKQSR